MIKYFIVFILFFGGTVFSQDKNIEEELRIKREKRQIEINKKLLNEKQMEELRSRGNSLKIISEPTKDKKGIAKIFHIDGSIEEFEFDRKSKYPKDNGLSKKRILTGFNSGNVGLKISGLYTLKEEEIENNLELHFDSLFTWGVRASFLNDKDNPKYSFFGGINFRYCIAEYGYSELNYSIIRFRSTINFSLIGKDNGRNDSLMSNYPKDSDDLLFSDNYYHYEGFMRSIFIEPILEFRISHEDGALEIAAGLSFGVNF